MSVQQVKNRFEELSTYLGRDAEGLKKLKSLKDAVNVLRTDRAAATERAENAEKLRDAAIQQRRAAEAEVANLHAELRRVQAESHSLALQLRNVRAILDGSEDELAPARPNLPDPFDYVDGHSAAVSFAVERLRKLQPYCPAPRSHLYIALRPEDTAPEKAAATYLIWDRNELSTGWGYEALWQLGATVAALVACEQHVVISSQLTLSKKMAKMVHAAAKLHPDYGGAPVPLPSPQDTKDLSLATAEYQLNHAANIGHWYAAVDTYKATHGHVNADGATITLKHLDDQEDAERLRHITADVMRLLHDGEYGKFLADTPPPGFLPDELMDVT